MYLKDKEKKRYKSPHYIPQKDKHSPYQKSPILTLPLRTWLLSYPKLFPIFVMNNKGQGTQAVISSSPIELASLSSSSSSPPEPSSSPSSSEAYGDGDGEAVNQPITTYHHAIRPTQVFTWHNSLLKVSRRAFMHLSCVMMASRVTPPAE